MGLRPQFPNLPAGSCRDDPEIDALFLSSDGAALETTVRGIPVIATACAPAHARRRALRACVNLCSMTSTKFPDLDIEVYPRIAGQWCLWLRCNCASPLSRLRTVEIIKYA